MLSSVIQLLKFCKQEMIKTGFSKHEADIDAMQLISRKLNVSFSDMSIFEHGEVSIKKTILVLVALQRILKGEPIAHVVGRKFFFYYDFIVNKNTLIPRADSECIVDFLIYSIKKYINRFAGEVRILDLGCGTGCLALSLMRFCIDNKICKEMHATFVDINEDSISVARQNSLNLDLFKSCTFLCADFTDDNFYKQLIRYDIVISNPPYVSLSEMSELSEALSFEPIEAIYGGVDGLLFYRSLATLLTHDIMNEGGLLALEIGWLQKKKVVDIFSSNANLKLIHCIKDLAGRNRGLLHAKIKN